MLNSRMILILIPGSIEVADTRFIHCQSLFLLERIWPQIHRWGSLVLRCSYHQVPASLRISIGRFRPHHRGNTNLMGSIFLLLVLNRWDFSDFNFKFISTLISHVSSIAFDAFLSQLRNVRPHLALDFWKQFYPHKVNFERSSVRCKLHHIKDVSFWRQVFKVI